jgi:hypothetical protein
MSSVSTRHYLLFSFSFYLLAQAFQQYVLLVGPLASVTGMEQSILSGQHSLNSVRHYLIYASMFLMVPAFVILGLHFFKQNPVVSIVAIVFLLLFCLLEISYRSIHIFQVHNVWGKEFAEASAEQRLDLLPKFKYFYQTINAIYFPLLTSLLIGSGCLCILSYRSKEWVLCTAMVISSIQQISRLTSYTPLKFLDVFSGIWYFVLVFVTFGLLIIWAVRDLSRTRNVADRI